MFFAPHTSFEEEGNDLAKQGEKAEASPSSACLGGFVFWDHQCWLARPPPFHARLVDLLWRMRSMFWIPPAFGSRTDASGKWSFAAG